MDPEIKKFLNSIYCPICGSAIDLLNYIVQRSIAYKSFSHNTFNFGCANNYRHYILFISHWIIPPSIDEERLIIIDKNKQYTITKNYNSLVLEDQIVINAIDDEQRVLEHIKPKLISFDGKLLDLQKMSVERLISAIKTLITFG